MKKKTEQVNGKGDKSRVTNKKKFDKNWEKIFVNQNPFHNLSPIHYQLPLLLLNLQNDVRNHLYTHHK